MKHIHKHPSHLPSYQPSPVTIVMPSTGAAPPVFWLEDLRRPLRHLGEQVRSLTGWGLHPKPRGATRVRRQSLPQDKDGITLSYLAAGTSGAPRLIFVHGSPGRGDEWQPYLDS